VLRSAVQQKSFFVFVLLDQEGDKFRMQNEKPLIIYDLRKPWKAWTDWLIMGEDGCAL
jgi:hypothetical protein